MFINHNVVLLLNNSVKQGFSKLRSKVETDEKI
jgi:hypothetical protein